MLRHPFLVAFDTAELDAQVRLRGKQAKVPALYLPFDNLGFMLRVTVQEFGQFNGQADAALADLAQKVRTTGAAKRPQMWADFQERRLGTHPGLLRVLLFRWAPNLPPESFTRAKFDLSIEFMIHAVGLEDSPATSGLAKILRNRCAPVRSPASIRDAAFELQSERDQDALFREFGPRLLMVALMLFPAGQAAVAVGAVINAFAGFLQFMIFLEDAEADGDITEQELEEAWWTLLGILPFRAVQLGLMLRGLTMVGQALIQMIVEGVKMLPDLLERRLQALRAGFSDYAEYDPGTTIFLPAYALDDSS
jgi:hypothetical protein